MKTAMLMTFVLLVCACGATPKVQHYSVVYEREASARAPGATWSLGVDYLIADAAYDDVRIVYRKSPYRLDYYHYHRWSAPPGVMVTDLLRQGFQESGQFREVVGGFSADVDLLLRGRLLALEEVDVSETQWRARVKLDLQLQDMRTGRVIWSRMVREEEELEERTPEGLAKAMSSVLTRVVVEITPKMLAARRGAGDVKSAQ